jgi:hypothetical protein
VRRTLFLLGSAVCIAIGAFGQTTTSFTLTNVSGPSLGGVYTSPYIAAIGNPAVTTTVICDDFLDDTYFNESWTAFVTNLSQLDSPATPNTTVLWGQSGSVATATYDTSGNSIATSLSQADAYITAALLAEELLPLSPSSQAAQDLSFAMWGLFDPAALNSLSGADLTNAQKYITNAVSQASLYTLADFSNVTIYTYDPPPPGGTGVTPTCGINTPCPGPPPPQEFIAVSMAEPSSYGTLAVYTFGGAFLLFLGRRRILPAGR